MAWKGKYKVKNPEKYTGDFTKVTYRSSWELAYMRWCDDCSRVLRWNSEEIVVPYRCPTDSKMHRYYTDFYVKVLNEKTGEISENIIEIKPHKQTVKPKQNKNKKRYIAQVKVWLKNNAKWKAAKKYADERGMHFFVLTENELNIPSLRKK